MIILSVLVNLSQNKYNHSSKWHHIQRRFTSIFVGRNNAFISLMLTVLSDAAIYRISRILFCQSFLFDIFIRNKMT